MANDFKTRKDIESALIVRAWKDDTFRQQLLADPKAAIAQVIGRSPPDDVQVAVHQETAKTIHLVLPMKPQTGGLLGDEDLQQVAGGLARIGHGPLNTNREACGTWSFEREG